MTGKEVLAQLKSLGDKALRDPNAKDGAPDNQFGVKLGDIRALSKKVKTNHELALRLWRTGNVDAQFLATLIIEPKSLTADELDTDALLDRIEAELAKAKPEEQWTMNNTLFSIGVSSAKLRTRAIKIGEKIGLYKDWPMSKGCIPPDVPFCVPELVRRQSK